MRSLNLSYESLTSFTTREMLCQLKTTDPEFWREMDEGRQHAVADLEAGTLEDESTSAQLEEEVVDDDSTVLTHQVSVAMVPSNIGGREGGIVACGEAESLDFRGEDETVEVEDTLGCGKRKRTANTLYSNSIWLSHND